MKSLNDLRDYAMKCEGFYQSEPESVASMFGLYKTLCLVFNAINDTNKQIEELKRDTLEIVEEVHEKIDKLQKDKE